MLPLRYTVPFSVKYTKGSERFCLSQRFAYVRFNQGNRVEGQIQLYQMKYVVWVLEVLYYYVIGNLQVQFVTYQA